MRTCAMCSSAEECDASILDEGLTGYDAANRERRAGRLHVLSADGGFVAAGIQEACVFRPL
jgi:hypothetical protein